MKKVLLVLGLSVGLVSNLLGNEPVRTRKSVVEVSTEVSFEDITLEVSEVVLEEVEEEFDFEFLYPTLEVSEVVFEEIEEEFDFEFLYPTLEMEELDLEEVEEKYQENINL